MPPQQPRLDRKRADDWSFPRTLQKIKLPRGERMTAMEKLTFPFYYHDGREDGREDLVGGKEDRGDDHKLVFGWSFPHLKFASPTVLGKERSGE